MSERTTKGNHRSTNGKAKTKVTTARRRSEPRLGELEFSEWYETPVFEPTNEERMETMATGGRAPSRLVARVVLAAGARRERRRAERRHQEPDPEENVESVAESPAPAVPEAAPEPAPAAAATATPTEPTEPEPVLIPELADRPGWRRKASDLLDRWAEKEVAVATKLDEALAPAIPWGGHKKPAHSRRNRSS